MKIKYRFNNNNYIMILLSLFFSVSVLRNVYCIDYDKQIKEYKQKIKKSKKELVGIKTEISQKEKHIKTITKEETSLELRLESILRILETTAAELQNIQKLIIKQQKTIEQTKNKLEIAKIETIKWKNILKNEIRFAYKQGVGRTLADDYPARIVLSSNSSADLTKKFKFLQLLAKQKLFIYLQTMQNVEDYEELKIKLESELHELMVLENKKKNTEQIFFNQKREREKLLSNVIKKRMFYEQEVGNLKDSEKMLAQLISLIEKKAKETEKQKEEERLSRIKIVNKKGYLSWPIEGEESVLKKNISASFGKQKHPELDTWIINNGIRIKSTLGQNVNAIDTGIIVFAGDFKSYGKMVIIDHSGGFYTVYGNLDKILIKEEQAVSKGDTIGIVGISLYSQDASLYFEIRRDGIPQNPLSWLK